MSADPQAPEYGEGGDRSLDARRHQPILASRARAGVTGHNVRYVLAFSLIAAVVTLLGVYLVYV